MLRMWQPAVLVVVAVILRVVYTGEFLRLLALKNLYIQNIKTCVCLTLNAVINAFVHESVKSHRQVYRPEVAMCTVGVQKGRLSRDTVIILFLMEQFPLNLVLLN
jgi:hypothetical protein